ncbi:MAG: alpha/beta hydrolase, partial [Taibaiella sp.]|nr:alpha/beta hydrolase [Taibaiella sp.]
MKKLLSSILFLFVAFALHAQEPARKALLGATGTFSAEGMKVDSIAPGSTLAAAGLKKGDILVTLNDKHIETAQQYYTFAADIRAGEKITITYTRNGAEKASIAKAVARPYETSALADVYYDWVPYQQCSLRAVTRKPKTIKKGPAVLLIPGYNCGSVENFSTGIYKHLIDEWLKLGFIVVTVEKSGLGDSYNCKPCSQVDLVTDMQTFDAAYRYMEHLPYADKNNLFIGGHSMGGVIAPEIARKHQPKGVVVFATVFRPWAEFLPEMHRVQFPLDGHSYTKTEQDVRMIHRIYDEFFDDKKT